MLKQAVLLLTLAGLALAAQKSYDGYQVFRTGPLTAPQAQALGNLQTRSLKFDFWKDPVVGFAAEIMSSPEDLTVIKSFFQLHNIQYTIKIENVQKLAEMSQVKKSPSSPRLDLSWFRDYHNHNEINAALEEYAAAFDFIDIKTIGSSYEGREMKMLQIHKAGPTKPNIFIEAGIHAREWIAPAVAMYTLFELVDNNAAHPRYLDEFNFHVIPVANPDGYEYSISDDRLWRKSRSDTGSVAGCMGVDMNRNFAYHFGESGVSDNKCSDVWPGEVPFSEIESQHLRDYFWNMTPKPQITICFHSAAELWLWPYGYAYDVYPPNVDEIIEMAEDAVVALNAVHGENFIAENSAALYPAAGASDDWYQSEGSRFTYTPELRDNGYGFVLPPQFIIPSGEEVWAAWESMLNRLLNEKKKQ